MKRFVNGEEVELDPKAAEVTNGPDRLYVRTSHGQNTAVAVRKGDSVLVSYKGRQYVVDRTKSKVRGTAGSDNGELRAPMPGQIVDVLVVEGQAVKKGERLLVLEAMKTQQPFNAPFDGVVEKMDVEKGAQVVDGKLLVIVRKVTDTSI